MRHQKPRYSKCGHCLNKGIDHQHLVSRMFFLYWCWCYSELLNGSCFTPPMSLISVPPPRLLSWLTQWSHYLLLFSSSSVKGPSAQLMPLDVSILSPIILVLLFNGFTNTDSYTHTQTCGCHCDCVSTSKLNITVKCVFPLGYFLPIVHWLCVQGLFVSAWLELACLLWLNGSRGVWGLNRASFGAKECCSTHCSTSAPHQPLLGQKASQSVNKICFFVDIMYIACASMFMLLINMFNCVHFKCV